MSPGKSKFDLELWKEAEVLGKSPNDNCVEINNDVHRNKVNLVDIKPVLRRKNQPSQYNLPLHSKVFNYLKAESLQVFCIGKNLYEYTAG